MVLLGVTTGNARNLPQSSTGISPENGTAVASSPKWQDPILKGVSEGGLAIVSLGFAAFAFLYGSLLTVKDSTDRALKTKLRHALYGTAVAVVLATALSILAFVSIGIASSVLGFLAIALALGVLLLLAGMTAYLALDVYRGGRTN